MRIEKNTYQGYVWMSNEDSPIVINGEYEKTIEDNMLPFIVEGVLASDKESITIKYIDGKYYVCKTPLNTSLPYTETDFVANRIPEVSSLRFRRFWKCEPDDSCLNMDVLIPSNWIFVGFNK